METVGIDLSTRRWMDLANAAVYADLPTKCLRRAIANGDLAFSKPGRKDNWLLGMKHRLN